MKDKHIRHNHWVHTELFVVRVEVDAVIPAEDPSETCFEPATLRFLNLVREKADAGDVDWLRTVGEVYARVPA